MEKNILMKFIKNIDKPSMVEMYLGHRNFEGHEYSVSFFSTTQSFTKHFEELDEAVKFFNNLMCQA